MCSVVLFSCILNQCFDRNVLNNPMRIFVAKYTISTPLIIENPVRSPMVPPMADNMSTALAALSLVIRSNDGVSKLMLTNLRLSFHSYSRNSAYIPKCLVS